MTNYILGRATMDVAMSIRPTMHKTLKSVPWAGSG